MDEGGIQEKACLTLGGRGVDLFTGKCGAGNTPEAFPRLPEPFRGIHEGVLNRPFSSLFRGVTLVAISDEIQASGQPRINEEELARLNHFADFLRQLLEPPEDNSREITQTGIKFYWWNSGDIVADPDVAEVGRDLPAVASVVFACRESKNNREITLNILPRPVILDVPEAKTSREKVAGVSLAEAQRFLTLAKVGPERIGQLLDGVTEIRPHISFADSHSEFRVELDDEGDLVCTLSTRRGSEPEDD